MERRSVSLLFFAAFGVSAPALCAACGPACDRNPSGAPVSYDGGTTAQGVYQSAPPCGPYLDFPGGRTYRFWHGLAARPRNYAAFFSFDEYPLSGDPPCPGAPGSGSVIGAGSQATFEAVTAEYIDVRNDSCSEVRIRVVADDPEAGGGGDAGP